MLPVVGIDNVFTRGSVTATDETADGPAANAVNGLTYDYLISSGGSTTLSVSGESAAADYVAIAAHNLADIGASIRVEYFSGSWTAAMSDLAITTNGPVLVEFPQQTGTGWRLVITGGSGAIYLGVANIGLLTRMQRGMPLDWEPPLRSNEEVERSNAFTVGGQILGSNIVRQNISTTVPQNNATRAWVDSVWEPLIAQAQLAPLFFRWSEDHAETVYGALDGAARSRYGSADVLNVQMTIEGLVR